MRLDKFLKAARIIKRRIVAKEVTDKGRVSVNGKTAKAGTVLKVGDEIEITFGQKVVRVRVELLKESPRKEEAETMYTLLSEEKIENESIFAQGD